MIPLALAVAFIGAIAWILGRWRAYRQAVANISNYPGLRLMFGITSALGNLLPPIPHIAPGRNHSWESKHRLFDRTGAEVYGGASVFPPVSYFAISDPGAIKQISYSRYGFQKQTAAYEILSKFGSNLLITEGEEWKRQRRICAPAFSDRNNRLVWSTAKDFTNEMLGSWAVGRSLFVRDVREDVTLPLALCVIAQAGFGQEVRWGNEVVPAGHQITFKEALSTASSNMHLPLILPSWAWGLRGHWRKVKLALDESRSYLHEMIQTRREIKEQGHGTTEQKHDLFNQLIHARDSSDILTEDELIGNVFIFLLAGHETTAHTLAIALALLALYPEEQDRLVEQISELHSEAEDFTYDHMHKLTYAMAVVYETLRLFPMVTVIPKQAVAATTFTVGHPPNTQTIRTRASTPVYILTPGLHYSPSYWDNPEDFVPARFMDPHWNRDAFVAFSIGPRACIGRRFAETTIVGALVTLISKYRVSIDESQFQSVPGESILERRTRLINPKVLLTLTPSAVPLVFSPRG